MASGDQLPSCEETVDRVDGVCATRVTPPAPEVVDDYRLVEEIGRGAMGTVFLAHDTVLDRPVALKFLDIDDATGVARERFRQEARAIARVQHPNVVAVHRVGEVAGQLYIVSEFVRGKGLHQLAYPVPADEALRIGVQLSRGLAAAHRKGVLHRDIKPANAVISDTGEVKLIDFGLAHLFDVPDAQPDASAFQGTPAYMAPELWRGETGSFRSDVFALGAVLHHLCSGAPPHGAESLHAIVRSMSSGHVPTLSTDQVDPALAVVIARCLSPHPEARYADADALRDALEALMPERRFGAVPEGNPYRGLQSFQAEHQTLFYGRDAEIRAVMDRLRTDPLVVVAGTSGVGKSSLCRAGVLPRIEAGTLGDGIRWRTVLLTPGRHPLTSLAAVLARFLGEDEATLAERMASDWPEVARALRQRQRDGEGLLVFFDQLEELVTLSAPEEAKAVAEIIEGLTAFTPGLRVLATVRGDFIGRMAQLPALAEALPRGLYLLRPLQLEGLREAVLGPARATGIGFESPALVDALVKGSDADGALPLLQFTLAELWDKRDVDRRLITQAALDSLGGVDGALSRHADGVLAQLLTEQEVAARRMLLRLVTLDDTRARRTEAELYALHPRAPEVLAALVRGRLLVASRAGDTWAYEVAHEALLSRWPTLRRWLEEAKEMRSLRERLAGAISEWRRLGGRAGLWNRKQLAEAAVLAPDELLPEERAFLTASSRALLSGRRLKWAAALTLTLVVAGAWLGLRVRHELALRARVAAFVSHGQASLDEAQQVRERLRPERTAALALFDAGKVDEAEVAWARVTELGRRVDRALSQAAQALEGALALDASEGQARALLAEALFTRAVRAEDARDPELAAELLARVSLYDPARAAQWNAPAHLRIVVTPPTASLSLYRIERQSDGSRREVAEAGGDALPNGARLQPGGWIVVARLGDREVRLPIVVRRGERRTVQLRVPTDPLPSGFAWVPPGPFVFGSTAEDTARRDFYFAAPAHVTEGKGFLISRTETTFDDWLDYLEALPPSERAHRLPRVDSGGFRGGLSLEHGPSGWVLSFQRGLVRFRARAGERLHPAGRPGGVDWRKLPVAGVTFEDAKAYAAWLHASGKVPGARLCTEAEWERAARGADDREFPHGDRLSPTDANVDATYGKRPEAMGADEVGSYPASRSPFGVDDLVGNVFEWTTPVIGSEPLAKGGSFSYGTPTARISNRERVDASFRDASLGLRVCADLPDHSDPLASRPDPRNDE